MDPLFDARVFYDLFSNFDQLYAQGTGEWHDFLMDSKQPKNIHEDCELKQDELISKLQHSQQNFDNIKKILANFEKENENLADENEILKTRVAILEKDVKEERNATKMAKNLNEEIVNELKLSEELIDCLEKQLQESKIELKEEKLSKKHLLTTMKSLETEKMEQEHKTKIMNKEVEELKIRVKELEATDYSEKNIELERQVGKLTAQLQDFESSRGYEQELILSLLEFQKRKSDKQLKDLQSKLERNLELVELNKLHEEVQSERLLKSEVAEKLAELIKSVKTSNSMLLEKTTQFEDAQGSRENVVEGANDEMDTSFASDETRTENCQVCDAPNAQKHYNAQTCGGCSQFFRKIVIDSKQNSLKCSGSGRCKINTVTRNYCSYCRYAKCVSEGMDAGKVGERIQNE
ncbi:Nuclear receptor domain-containing protein [Caenorhabditis elegans]|uniref:Nuclear receptor domain-containing protein n=1 Tax=Caenorhabditis elegans TaxID=6239 RepID=Q9U2V3_CAEEL|nr:Nuclear receptor domain-containing protein [Caenorhabditis elegans]CAB55124.3 Nuclear receptor domain-containing protein [Caenorhabditis elegans]|eukprot:NP_503018.3 Nuclear Hormone Receptor family [Caenorhabditis elegans]